jgi:predicted nucleic acid-binding protein
VILLDTNVVSELQKPNGNPRVKQAIERRMADLYLSVITLGEILYGVALLEAGARRRELERYYRRLEAAFGDRVLPVSAEIAENWAQMRADRRNAGRPLALADGLIAATALVHDLTLWTRNMDDFKETGARLLNPWED